MNLDLTPVKREHDLASRECSHLSSRIESLRDFFYAENRIALKRSYTTIADLFNDDARRQIDWQRIEYSFNRLFVGPLSPAAPPYASVYMDEKSELMGASTLVIRNFYSSLGLNVPKKGAVPDDFISYELDALLVILHHHPQNSPALEWLVLEHMMKWIPQFCEKCRQSGNTSFLILNMVNLLEATIENLSRMLTDEVG